jgi:hypothetical protein
MLGFRAHKELREACKFFTGFARDIHASPVLSEILTGIPLFQGQDSSSFFAPTTLFLSYLTRSGKRKETMAILRVFSNVLVLGPKCLGREAQIVSRSMQLVICP